MNGHKCETYKNFDIYRNDYSYYVRLGSEYVYRSSRKELKEEIDEYLEDFNNQISKSQIVTVDKRMKKMVTLKDIEIIDGSYIYIPCRTTGYYDEPIGNRVQYKIKGSKDSFNTRNVDGSSDDRIMFFIDEVVARKWIEKTSSETLKIRRVKVNNMKIMWDTAEFIYGGSK